MSDGTINRTQCSACIRKVGASTKRLYQAVGFKPLSVMALGLLSVILLLGILKAEPIVVSQSDQKEGYGITYQLSAPIVLFTPGESSINTLKIAVALKMNELDDLKKIKNHETQLSKALMVYFQDKIALFDPAHQTIMTQKTHEFIDAWMSKKDLSGLESVLFTTIERRG